MEYPYKLDDNNKAAINNGILFIHSGLRKIEIPFADIRGYYRYETIGNKYVLAIAGSVSGGKKKKWNIVLNPKESGSQTFFNELIAHAPESANLLHLEKKQALKILGMNDQIKVGIIVVSIIMLVVVVGMLLPQFWHSIFDAKLTPATVKELYQGSPLQSGYLSVPLTLGEKPLVVNYRRWSLPRKALTFRERRKKGFYPIVPKNWRQGDPIKAVLLVDGAYRLGKIAKYEGKGITISGVVRNILWEKFYWSSYMDDLSREKKSPVVKNPIVIDYETTPSGDGWLWGGLLIFCFFIFGVLLWKNRKIL